MSGVKGHKCDSGDGGSFVVPGVLGVEWWWRFWVERVDLLSVISRGWVNLKSQMMLSNLIAGYLRKATRRAHRERLRVNVFA